MYKEDTLYPVNKSQKTMVLERKLLSDALVYNLLGLFKLHSEAPINKRRFWQAYQAAIERQPETRAFFVEQEGEIYQKIAPKVTYDTPVYKVDSQEELYALKARLNTPFDVSKAPLFKVALIEWGEELYFFYCVYHSITDTIGVIEWFQETLDIYSGKELKPLEVTAIDFAEEEALRHTSGLLEEQEKFWLAEYQDGVPALDMATDKPRPAMLQHEGRRLVFDVDEAMGSGIKQVAKKNKATPFSVMLAAYSVLMSRYTGKEDMVVGVPFAGRTQRKYARTIGMFVNNLPWRMKPTANKTLDNFIKEIDEKKAQMNENQEYPLAKLVETLGIPTDTSHNSLFDVSFNFIPAIGGVQSDALSMEFVRDDVDPAVSDITFRINKRPKSYYIELTYSKALFEKATMEQFARHYLAVLREIIADSSVTIANIRVLDETDSKRLQQFNDTREAYDEQLTILDLFKKNVDNYPEKIAVTCKNTSLTYAELDRKTNRIAQALKKRGIGREDVVAFLLPRKENLLCALYGILKSGAAFLPIDPEYPPERITHVLTDSQAKYIVIAAADKAKIASGNTIDIAELLAEENQSDVDNNIRPEDLCYMIYTSGSTGKPKGVMIEHKNTANFSQPLSKQLLTKAMAEEGHKAVAIGTIAFDIALSEIFPALSNGLTVILADEEESNSPLALGTLMLAEKVDVLQITPSRLLAFLEEATFRKALGNLTILLSAAEVFTPKLLAQLRSLTTAKILNGYGPSECCIGASYDEITGDDLTIGWPISNVEIHILDAYDQEVPIGVYGELCIAGACVGRGYYNRPELTAEKFVMWQGKRIYKTGDFAAWRQDGKLSFKGRVDDLVKVNGLRIELGEIENAIQSFDAIKRAVVLVQSIADNEYLCAYYQSEAAVDVEKLRAYLAKSLVRYMIPAVFIKVESFVVTPNGKIDKEALPKPDLTNLQTAYIAPATKEEQQLCEIMQEALGVARVGMNDDFFALGGTSLKVIQLQLKIYQQMRRQLKISDLFVYTTPLLLLELLEKNDETGMLPVAPESYPTTPAQRQMYILRYSETSATNYNIPMTYRILGKVSRTKFEQAFAKLVTRHSGLRTYFFEKEGNVWQGIVDKIQYTILKQQAETEEQAKEIIASWIQPFDLSKPGVFRLGLIELSPKDNIIFLDTHHSIIDGLSVTVLMKELMQLYHGEELEVKRVDYKDFAVWQNDRIALGLFEKQDAYWLEVYKYEIPVLELETDEPRPLVRSDAGRDILCEIDRDLTRDLQQVAKKEKTTLFTVLFAAYTACIARYARQEDIVIGVPFAGRVHSDTESMVGMFVSIQAIRVKPSGEKTFAEYLGEVKEVMQNAQENQDYPIERLVKKLGIKAESAHNPLFDIVFNFLPATENIKYEDISLQSFITDYNQSKFDLALTVFEQAETLCLDMNYCSALFKAETIERLLTNFKSYLAAICQPEEKLKDIDFIAAAEKEILLQDFQNVDASIPQGRTYIELFEEQVARTPDNIAVVDQNMSLTYRELSEKADVLAGELSKQGVQAESIVAVMLPRTVEYMIAVLAIMKAGGAYLPIDAEYPMARIEHMLTDSKALVLISHAEYREKAVGFANMFIALETFDFTQGSTTQKVSHQPHDLAYVIYTSGSTGKPKGVMLEQHNLLNVALWAKKRFAINEKDAQSAYFSFSFDGSVRELFPALISGASVHILAEELRLSPERIKEYTESHEVTLSIFPTQFAEIFMQISQNIKSLRAMAIGGEKLKHYAKVPYEIVNEYGPTENTVISTFFSVDKLYKNIPIGKPVANVGCYVVDQNLKLQPIGALGELCVSGNQVARGYLYQEELTKQAFVDNPYQRGEVDAKLYRTGDLVRWLADGNLEYISRIDKQVKINGFRIEIGEIEQTLLDMAEIREAAVADFADENGRSYLCAYYVTTAKLEEAEIKSRLQMTLPNYMIPVKFIEMEQMPLTPNGKIDKKALPEPQFGYAENNQEDALPINEKERLLCEVFVSVLGVKTVTRFDNFFELGGDSLAAIRIVAALSSKGHHITIQDIMQKQYINELAALLSTKQQEILAEQGVLTGDVKLLPIQKWFVEHRLEDPDHFNQSLLFETKQPLAANLTEQTLREIVLQQDALRLCFDAEKSYYSQEVNFGFQFITEPVEDIKSVLDAYERTRRLSSGNLLQGVLLNDITGKQYLFISIHHWAVDGYSWQVFVDLFITIYQALQNHSYEGATPKKTSYRQWSDEIYNFATNLTEEEIQYWQDIDKKSAEQVLAGKRTSVMAAQKHEQQKIVFAAATPWLKDSYLVQGAKVNEILLGALIRAYGELTQQPELVINLEGHGREHIADNLDISQTMGWFTSVYPQVFAIKQDLEEQIEIVKYQLQQIPYHGLGYGALRYHTNKLSPEPLETLTFNYLGEAANIDNDLLQLSTSAAGNPIGEQNHLIDMLAVNGFIAQGNLELTIDYDANQLDAAFIKRWMEALGKNMSAYIENIKEYAGCSPILESQKGIYLACERDQDSVKYNEASEVTFKAAINPEKVKMAFQAVIEANTAFRTVFKIINGKILQFVATDKAEDIPIYEETQAEYELRKEKFSRPFDFQTGPLYHLEIHCVENTVKVLFEIHHIIYDRTSMFVIFEELQQALAGNALNSNKVTCAEAAVEESAMRSSQHYQECKEFFVKRFSKREVVTNLIYDKTAKTEIAATGEVENRVEPVLRDRIIQVSRTVHVTENAVFLSALECCLAKYTNNEEVVLGTISSGRDDEKYAKTVGMFVRTMPLYQKIEMEEDTTALLQAVQQNLQESIAHSSYSYSELVNAIGSSQSPIFSILYTYQNVETNELDEENLPFEVKALQAKDAKFDVTFMVLPLKDSYLLGAEYNPNLYEKATIQRFVANWKNCLQIITEDVLEDKKCALKNIDVVAAAEKDFLLQGFQNTDISIPQDKTYIELFEQQVARTPENIAVVDKTKSLTYWELNEKSTVLAGALSKQGVQAESIVAVMLPRTVEYMIAVLAIMKAGGAYLPIDAEYPLARIEHMLTDSGALVLISHEKYREKAADFANKFIALETFDFRQSSANQKVNYQPHDLAYLIYTSGSTGKPKGVMLEQHNLLNVALWAKRRFAMTGNDAQSAYFSFSFDGSVRELFPALISGASVHILAEELRLSPEKIKKYIETKHITLSIFPTQFAEIFMQISQNITSLRAMAIGGEKLKHYEPVPYEIVNEYGPTENTVIATFFSVDKLYKNIPIGKPVANVGCYVVDQHLNLQPIGAAGELCVSGNQVARGYLYQEELTKQVFVDNPYKRGEADNKLYRTGDLVRWNQNGNLEYIGRIDDQVKLRGFRIELGEIESKLAAYPGITSAVAEVKEINATQHLCAYFTADKAIATEELQRYLAETLTDYMVPTAYLQLDKLPLTPNGKINRKVLPLIELTANATYAAPQNEVESVLAQTMARLFQKERVGIDDSFFSLGGDSIKAIRLASLLRQQGMKVTVADIMQGKTIRAIAAKVSNIESFVVNNPVHCQEAIPTEQESKPEEFTYNQAAIADVYPMTSVQKSMVYLAKNSSEAYYHEQTLYEITDPVDAQQLQDRLRQVTAAHEVLRTWFDFSQESQAMQMVNKADTIDFFYQDISNFSKKAQQSYIETLQSLDRKQGFDFAKAPLFRIKLLQLNEASQLLMVCFSHAILDGWSMGILMSQLLSKEEKIERSPSNHQYTEWLMRQDKEKAGAFWRSYLGGTKQATILPRTASGVSRQCTEKLVINEAELRRINTYCQKQEITVSIYVQAAWASSLMELNGTDDVTFGYTLSGRSEEVVDIEKMVGNFITTIPIRIRRFGESGNNQVQQLQGDNIQIQKYAYLSLGEIQQAARLRHAAFDHFLTFQNTPLMESKPGISAMSAHNKSIHHLNVMVVPGTELIIAIAYDSGYHNYGQIQNIAKIFRQKITKIINY